MIRAFATIFVFSLATCILTGCGGVSNPASDAGASCPSGLTDCDGVCVDTSADNANCGSCGNVCDPGQICDGNGSCVLSCQDGLTECEGVCTDTSADNANCGGCGNACDPGQICDGDGTCALSCQEGLTDCDGVCIDPASNPDYCGAGPDCSQNAGAACGQDEACVQGSCQPLYGCQGNDVAQGGGCLLETACNGPPQEVFAGGNCSANTAEFADWWCQLGGYAGALSFTEVTTDSFSAHYYSGGAEQVLSTCAQVDQAPVHPFSSTCTGARDLVCRPTQIQNDLRADLLQCGNSSRDLTTFIPDGVNLTLVASCTPDADTQAMLVTRTGAADLDGPAVRDYLNGGGILLTEFNTSDEVWSAVLPDVSQGSILGDCHDNAPTGQQFSADDPFWGFNPYQAPPAGESGCGATVEHFPFLTPLAGWDVDSVSIGYRNLGRGRLWVTEFDWQDNQIDQTQYTRDLLGYMITRRR